MPGPGPGPGQVKLDPCRPPEVIFLTILWLAVRLNAVHASYEAHAGTCKLHCLSHAKEDVTTTRLTVPLFFATEERTFLVPSTAGVTKNFWGSLGDAWLKGEAQ